MRSSSNGTRQRGPNAKIPVQIRAAVPEDFRERIREALRSDGWTEAQITQFEADGGTIEDLLAV
jgi:hypothetical protein